MHVFHSSHLNHLPGKELDLKSLAYTGKDRLRSKGRNSGCFELRIKPTGRERVRESNSLSCHAFHSLAHVGRDHSFCLEDHSFFTLLLRRERSKVGAYYHIETSEA